MKRHAHPVWYADDPPALDDLAELAFALAVLLLWIVVGIGYALVVGAGA